MFCGTSDDGGDLHPTCAPPAVEQQQPLYACGCHPQIPLHQQMPAPPRRAMLPREQRSAQQASCVSIFISVHISLVNLHALFTWCLWRTELCAKACSCNVRATAVPIRVPSPAVPNAWIVMLIVTSQASPNKWMGCAVNRYGDGRWRRGEALVG